MYDVIVVGGGPAGMTAALYALRNGKTVLVIEKNSFGGQITHSPKVENYPGTLSMSGNEFAEKTLDRNLAALNAYGYFDSDERCLTQTPGIFVAGDCRSKGVRQLTTAVADGATAALAACRYLNE